MNTIIWFQAEVASGGLGAIAQYGAVGIAVLLLMVHYKLMTDYRKSIDAHTEVLRDLCVVLESVKTTIQLRARGE